jgi:peptidoglycan glycosyltransferase
VNKELRRVSVVVLIMFLALFGSTSVIQVFQQDNLKASPHNVRALDASLSAERGSILVAGQPIATSVPSNDRYKYQRKYANGPLYSAVTGYFTLNQGNTGLESALNSSLSGTANDQFLAQLNAILTGQNPKGASVETTIDPAVQQAAWDALGNDQGAVVALNPKTGAILAMVSKPTFDPNSLAVHNASQVLSTYQQLLAAPGSPLINRTIAGNLNPPGSTFKLVVAPAAFANGYTPDSQFPNPAHLQLTGTNTFIGNSEGGACGGAGATVSIATAMQLSCNVPFAQLGQALGYDKVAAQAKAFGFGDSNLRIPMSVAPSVYPQTNGDAQQELSSFGQGNDRVTPLQLAMISAAIANGGTLMTPTLIDSIISPDLTVQKQNPTVYGQPVTSAIAATMTQLMINNVANGVASNARISGVEVAGKTGTAQNGEGNQPYTLLFTGFAPANNPQVAVAVVVENGGGIGQSGFGNTVAAPIAKKVIEAVLSR